VVGTGAPAEETVLGQSGNAYFHTDVYDDQERERRLFILGLYALLRNDSVALQGNVCLSVYACVHVCACVCVLRPHKDTAHPP
jgi:hypothetical protein